jgi:hypothetical protein
MLKTKTVVLVLVLLAVLMTSSQAWASSQTLWKLPQDMAVEEAGFRLEAPANIGDRAISATAEIMDYSKITAVDNFFVVSAVDLRMVSPDKKVINYLTKPVRLVFSFNYLDYKRASRLNTNLSIGHFRIGYWDEAQNNWTQIPSQVFWNGSNGAVEAESTHGTGKYALLWSYEDGVRLSPTASEGIRIMINMIPIKSDVLPYIKDGRTMVPLRVVAENMKSRVDWNDSEKRIDLVRNVDTIQLWIGKSEAFFNNKYYPLDVAPEITNGRTFVPLRFIAEMLGAKVTWDGVTQTVKLISYSV